MEAPIARGGLTWTEDVDSKCAKAPIQQMWTVNVWRLRT